MSYEELKKIITANNVTSIDQLIPLLPFEYRRNYTFIYDSQSLQKDDVTPDFPRALVYGEDAKFVLTFTKSPSDGSKNKGPDALETMEWDEKSASFKFREIIFDGKKNPLIPEPETNPQKCLACHGQDPRPIWEPYNFWPGVYGSLSRLGCDVIHPDSKEAKMYESFLKTGRISSRYKDLPTKDSGEGFKKLYHGSSACPEEKHINVSSGFSKSPNSKLNHELNKLNAKRIERMIKDSPKYPMLKYAVNAIARNCLGEIFPSEYSNSVSIDDIAKKVKTEVNAGHRKMLEKFTENNAALSDKENAFQPFDFVFEKRFYNTSLPKPPVIYLKSIFDMLEIPWEKVSMSFGDAGYSFAGPEDDIVSSVFYILENSLDVKVEHKRICETLIAKNHETIRAHLSGSCEKPVSLLKKNDEDLAFDTTRIVSTLSLETTINKLKQSCLNCHNPNSADGDLILNLYSTEAFGKQLKADPHLVDKIRIHLKGKDDNGKKIRRMPAGAPAFDEELQKQIIEDIRKLQ
jgi:hypothetical protein